MNDISCPHCGTMNPIGSRFCESCGKALPTGTGGGPRVVTKGEFAQNEAGQSLQAQELQKKMKSARGGLLAVAIIQIIFGAIFYFVISDSIQGSRGQITQADVNLAVGVIGIIGAIYFGLWAWAKSAPFPAALTGLILYVTIWVGEIIMDPSAIMQGILVKIIIIAVLGKAVQAGLEYRKLQARADGRLG